MFKNKFIEFKEQVPVQVSMMASNPVAELRKAIVSGKLAPGEMVGTEFAFSQDWGIARNTVRRRIAPLIDEGLLERRPGKGLFVSLPDTNTRTVQVIVPDLSWNHVVRIVRGAQEEGSHQRLQTQIYDAHGKLGLDLEMLRRLPHGPTDGAIIVSLHHRRFTEVLVELKATGYPFVLVDQRLHDIEVPTVEIDNYGGGYVVGQKLAEHGHRRVAFLGPMSLQVVADRMNGFRDATLDAGVLFDRAMVIDLGGEGVADWLNERLDVTQDAVIQLLSGPNRPTAIFDGSGDIAPLIYRAVQKLGLRIPEDVSVVAFDDSAKYAQFLEPRVAQLKHSWDSLGRAAMEMLILEMNRSRSNGPHGKIEHRVLSPEWEPGASLHVKPSQ
jgi:DNA-binding LacI/PurR family transcriptional regulator